jgi:aerobic-type carbon monoxide dehydrogenase small subunit (CoxS/CutS family)
VLDAGTVQTIEVAVNGEKHRATVPSRQLLVHFLRDTLGMKGTHIGCDTGSCGACTVIVDGKLTKSCMMLAPQAEGAEIETIEGVSPNGELTAVQRAFHEQHGLQCGYCTPGLVMAATFLLRRNPHPTEEEIRRAIRGNICRCTGYVNIVKSIAAAASGEAA